MAWDNIIADPEFQKQSAQVKARVAVNYFKEHIVSDPDFANQPVEVQGKVKANFFSSIQGESPFEARHPDLYALGKTFENVPRVLTSGATLGLTERVREGSRQLAEIATGKSLPETDPYEEIPSLSRGVGEFVGAAVPIGTAFGIAKPTVTKAAQYLLKGARAAEPLAAVATGAGLGIGYTVAEKGIKEGELPSASEIGMSAASWAGLETLGLGVQYASAIRGLAKELGVAPKIAQQIAVKEAKAAGMPDLEYTVNKTQIQKALRIMESDKSKPLAPDTPAKIWAENTLDSANQVASAWVNKVEELVSRPKQQGKVGTYHDLVDEKSLEATKAGLKQTGEDSRIGMFGKPYEEGTPEIKPIKVTPNAYIDPEALTRDALSFELRRIIDTPPFLRDAQDKVALQKFMQEGQATNISGKEPIPVIGDMQNVGIIQEGTVYNKRLEAKVAPTPMAETGDLAKQAEGAIIEPMVKEPGTANIPAKENPVAEAVKTHRPVKPGNGSALDDLTNSFSDDIYSKNALGYFGEGNSYDKQSINIIKSLKGKPDTDVTIYRAVDNGAKDFNSGDWVTINKKYAIDHGEGIMGGNYEIIEKTVKAKDLINSGDSIHEFGYYPPETTPKAVGGIKDTIELIHNTPDKGELAKLPNPARPPEVGGRVIPATAKPKNAEKIIPAITIAPDTEFALYEMRSQLRAGEKGGLKGQLDEGIGDYVYMGSGYPEWFTDMVKRFNDPKRSPLSGKVGISSREVITIISKKLDGKPLTWKQGVLYNDIERSAAREISHGDFQNTAAEYMREIGKGETSDGWAKTNIESAQIKSGEILDNQEHLKTRIFDEVKREGAFETANEEAVLKELEDFFSSVTSEKPTKFSKETATMEGFGEAENFNLAGQEPPKNLGTWEPNKPQVKNAEIPGTEKGIIEFHANPVVPMAKTAFKKIKGFFDDMEIKTLGKSTDETIGHAIRRVSQDKLIALRDWEDTLQKKYGITLSKRDSAYYTEERSHGIVADKLNTFDRDVVKPFIDSVVSVRKKHGLTLDDLDRYLKAKDAPNRNRVIQERNADRLANAKTPEEAATIQSLGSGLSDADAAEILQKYKGKEAVLDDLAKVVYWANKKKLDIIEKYGLESPEIIKQMRQTFGDTYVPWKGKEGLRGGTNTGTNKGIGAKNSGLKQALGRASESENSISHSFEDLKETISRIQKNEVGKSFLNLVKKYPDASFEINKVKLDQRLNPNTGQVETFNRPVWANGEPLDPFAENVVPVLRDGQHYYIRINDNPLLARALTASYDKPSALDHVVGTVGAITRNIASIYTRYSPSFVVTNPVRDLFDAMQGVATEYKISMAARAARLIPESTKDIYKYSTTGKGNVYTQEFAQNGGMVGFYSGKDYKETAKFFEKEIKRGTGNGAVGATYRTLSKVGLLLSDVTSSTENATRLAVYKTLRENGYSIEDAVSYVKNITINFNRHGEWKWLNQLYMFSNPAIQGIQRFGKLASTTKGQSILGGITGLAVALNEYNRYVAGEDEGGINNYDKISNTEKSRNIIIIDPSDSKPLVKIPLGFFQRLPFALATALSDSAHQTKGNTKIAMDVVDAMLDAFNPVGGSQLSTTLVPTPAKPVMELYANKNWLGNPIKPEQMPWDVRPESQMYFSGASIPSKFAAEKFNAATGGDEFTPGTVDISPESIDHVAQFFTGTLGKDIYRIMDLGARYFDGMRPLSDLKAGDIPIVGRFTGANTEFYTFSKFKEVSEEALRAYKKTDAWANSDDPRLDRFLDKHEGIVVLGQEVGKIQKEISSLNGDIRKVRAMKDLDDIDKREIIKELNQEKEKQMNVFIRLYNKVK